AGKGRSETNNVAQVIKKSFEKMFAKINEEVEGRDINVKEFYRDIYKKLEIVSKVLEETDIPCKQEILNKVDNIKSDINFLNELNKHTVYFQIPLKIFDKNTNGELYILKRNNGRKRIDPQNATVFLSLDTENLGQVDSLISVNKKNVSLNFRLEKNEIIDYIKENYIQLYEGLAKKGYKLVDIKYRLIDEKVNLLNAREVLEKEIERTRNRGFDCKI
ncbi:MAG: flagellar hook-length control protein FliK, partial [Hungateiclostridium thermocellum]|nr:flagellar hook-length control protein FliK [Acetivibrio thermocellus]